MLNRRDQLVELCERFPGSLIVLEVGTHSPWISRLLQANGAQVLVANPRKVKAIYSNNRKCDRLDAQMLARIGRLDPELLHPIEHVSDQVQRDLLPIKWRDALVRQRVAMISCLRGSLKSLGVRLPICSPKSFPKRARGILEEEAEAGLLLLAEPTLAAIQSMSEQIETYERVINESALNYPATGILRQITGVGPITSLSFVLHIESPDRFARTRDVGAYLGLIPGRDQSGDMDKQLPISKAGNRYVRGLLVQSAQYILGHFGPDCDLRTYGLRIATQGGKSAKKRAVVAVARKLAVLMLTLWKRGGDYQPQHQQSLAA